MIKLLQMLFLVLCCCFFFFQSTNIIVVKVFLPIHPKLTSAPQRRRLFPRGLQLTLHYQFQSETFRLLCRYFIVQTKLSKAQIVQQVPTFNQLPHVFSSSLMLKLDLHKLIRNLFDFVFSSIVCLFFGQFTIE